MTLSGAFAAISRTNGTGPKLDKGIERNGDEWGMMGDALKGLRGESR